jgi:hypothetical protein
MDNTPDVSFWVQIMLTTASKPFEGMDNTASLIEAKEFAEMLANSRQKRNFERLSVCAGDEIQIEGNEYKIDSIEMIIGNYPNGAEFQTVVLVTEI